MEQTKMKNMQELQDRIGKWQDKTFPLQTLEGKMNHLKLEAQEIIHNRRNLSEWADVLILYLGAADLEGFVVEELIDAANRKMGINENRKWGPPDANGVCSHIED